MNIGDADDDLGLEVSAGCNESALGICVESISPSATAGGRAKRATATSVNEFAIGAGDGTTTECALDVNSPVCSSDDAIAVVREFVSETMPDLPEEGAFVISAAKKITNCESEECVLTKVVESMPSASSAIVDTLAQDFRIDGPENTTAWLTNTNIDGILRQLTRKHPKLKHLDFHMIDFDRHMKPLAELDMTKDVINAGFDHFCVVINTDKYGGKGIHWFCLFCDFRGAGTHVSPWTIEYFNSSGARAPHSVAEWMIKTKYNIETNMADSGRAAKIVTAAPIQHQRDTDSECGVYCLYYIYRRIHNEPLATFRTRIPDAAMIAFRKKLFKDRSKPAA